MRVRSGDGNGWTVCAAGHRHWGRFGAAGLLLTESAATSADPGGPDGGLRVLLQLRSQWTHEGGTWSVPGGARDSNESVLHAALTEAWEEGEIPAAAVDPIGVLTDDHGGWSYSTVAARAIGRVDPEPVRESDAIRWVNVEDVPRLPLHRGFAATWPRLQALPEPLTIVVDAANVVGSVPDGWWRDRAGATGRLLDRLAPLARHGVPAPLLPSATRAGELTRLLPEVRVVVEGAARSVDEPDQAALRLDRAPGAGDDRIVAAAEEEAARGRQVVVVTADRGLRARLVGTAVSVSPSWLQELDSAPL